MALSAERDTHRRDTILAEPPVAANARIWAGGLVMIQAGYAVPGQSAVGLLACGIAEASVDNTGGAAGAKRVKTRRGSFFMKNSATDPVLAVDLWKDCYVVDDETVARTDGSGTRSKAGRVRVVETNGVWIEIA